MSVSDAAYESLMQFLYRAPIGLIQTTLNGDIEMLNPMSANLLMRLSKDGLLSNLFATLEGVAPQLRPLAAAAEESGGIVCESLRISAPASEGDAAEPLILSLSLLRLDEARLMAVIVDATQTVNLEQQRLLAELRAAARVDKLTGLPNRLVALEQLQLAMARTPGDPGYEFAVLYLSCDRLQHINDTFGLKTGDALLSMLAQRLSFTLRSLSRSGLTAGGVPMAARMGGDEFVIVLDDVQHTNDVCTVAQRLVEALMKPYAIGPDPVYCSVSMGIVLRDSAAGDADTVLQDASLAMMEAKRAGGARYMLFAASMRLRATMRGGIEADLRRALLTEDQLFVVYQPVVGLQGERCLNGAVDRSAGVESLVRWRHPTRGVVSPAEFIGVAEQCGLIDALGEFVLVTACRQFVRWQEELGPRAPRRLAVNISRGQLGRLDLVAVVAGILRFSGILPEQLQLEVTESLAAQDAFVQVRLHELKALGLTLALDDFGTGYSSLSSLHQIPVDTVKIDHSFVSQAETSLHHRVLIDATIRVAHSLGMNTVAEGIETMAQARIVRQLGCDKGQGYLFSKPLSSAELVQWLMVEGPSTAVA